MKNILCEYDDWFIYEDMLGNIFIQHTTDEDDGCDKLAEIFKIEFPNYETKSIEEILDMCPYNYDYSGELDDCSAYVFWEVI